MGIESDQVVYEYLSRVGDVAQQRQLPSSTRMRLVSELRNEIDRARATTPADTPAAVRRILARLGSPDEIVAAAGGGTGGTGGTGATEAPAASVPVQPDRESAAERPKGLRRVVPRPRQSGTPKPGGTSRPGGAEQGPAAPGPPSDIPSPPHLASAAELGGSATRPDWWRGDTSPFGLGESVPGFVGGIEIPELLRPPPPKEPETAGKSGAPTGTDGTAGAVTPGGVPVAAVVEKAGESVVPAAVRVRRRGLPRLPTGGWSNPLLLLAAALLVGGAVLGNWFALLLGWAIAYGSRRLTQAETKTAVMYLPGAAVAAGLVWLWGRDDGRWGTPVAQGHMSDAIGQTWPWVVRGAAVASALYLAWRSQRRR
ncbi:hypothetical protein [Streptomyces sp. NPDC005423]|uniref:HAAS signaling domain-containing protein n=1 Tax=Streptomyces sp. NPDC005423 TaxID=3155343 RepID=UPI0033A4A3CC